MMSHSLGFPDRDGEIVHATTWMYYPILCRDKDGKEIGDKLLFLLRPELKTRVGWILREGRLG